MSARSERVVTGVAVSALGLWVGGIVALGACAAPVIFREVPAPISGGAMGIVFQRFDMVAIACSVVVLGCEAARIASQGGRGSARADVVRGVVVACMAAFAIYQGVFLSPAIVALHAGGAVRGFHEDGLAMERLHTLAELLAQAQVLLGVGALMLEVVTLGEGREAKVPATAQLEEKS